MGAINYIVDGEYLLVPLWGGLDDAYLISLGEVIPTVVCERGIRGVILDFSALSFLDSFAARAVEQLAATLSLLGAATVFCGVRPGVAVSLVELGRDLGGIATALDKREAQSLLEARRKTTNTGSGKEERLSM